MALTENRLTSHLRTDNIRDMERVLSRMSVIDNLRSLFWSKDILILTATKIFYQLKQKNLYDDHDYISEIVIQLDVEADLVNDMAEDEECTLEGEMSALRQQILNLQQRANQYLTMEHEKSTSISALVFGSNAVDLHQSAVDIL